MIAPRYAAVVLPVPVSRSYIYEVPAALAARVVPGARVVVPLRRRSVVGIVVEAISRLPSAGIDVKSIIAAPDDEPAISPPLLELGRWMSDYYGAPLGLSLRAILPGPLWSVARPAGPAPAAERLLVLTSGIDSLHSRERRGKRARWTRPTRVGTDLPHSGNARSVRQSCHATSPVAHERPTASRRWDCGNAGRYAGATARSDGFGKDARVPRGVTQRRGRRSRCHFARARDCADSADRGARAWGVR